jgi:hypothetical protein
VGLLACGGQASVEGDLEGVRAAFHRVIHRRRPVPVGSRLITAKCGEALVLRGIGEIYMELGYLTTAEDYCQQAVMIYRSVGADKAVAGALLWQGMLRIKQERHSEAESLFGEVMQICRAIKN